MSASFDLFTDSVGRLILIDETGARFENVKPLRLFPLTEPERWVCLQDAAGKELRLIEDPSTLKEGQLTALRMALARRDFVPVIRSINRITRAADGHDWHVTTDRGPTTFRIETDESIQYLGGTRLVIIDDHNTRYLIPNIEALDRESRRKLERYY
jgi:hypothetical protein